MTVQAAALVRLDGCQHRVEAPVYVTGTHNHLLTANPGDCLQPGGTGTKNQATRSRMQSQRSSMQLQDPASHPLYVCAIVLAAELSFQQACLAFGCF